METLFYVLASVALTFYILDKISEWVLDTIELKNALKLKKDKKELNKK
jgi:hypothetical protein